jgi:ABC-type transporter Mla MlaB component
MTHRRLGSARVDVLHADGVTYLFLVGQLDALQLSALRLPLSGSRRVIFDLSGLERVDSAGIRALLRLQAAVTGAGGTVEIEGASGIVRHLLELALDPLSFGGRTVAARDTA